jgi:hypothetical protein
MTWEASLSYGQIFTKAIDESDVQCVSLFLQENAVPSEIDLGNSLLTAIKKIYYSGSWSENAKQIAKLLIEKGCNVDVEDPKIDRTNLIFPTTPLGIAAKEGDFEMVKFLRAHGAAIELLTPEEKINGGVMTPLAFSLKKTSDGHRETSKFLILEGADINMPNSRGKTPLHRSASTEDFEITKMLLERGANVHAKDENERTPLHKVGLGPKDAAEVATLLLQYGSDPTCRDIDDCLPVTVEECIQFSVENRETSTVASAPQESTQALTTQSETVSAAPAPVITPLGALELKEQDRQVPPHNPQTTKKSMSCVLL